MNQAKGNTPPSNERVIKNTKAFAEEKEMRNRKLAPGPPVGAKEISNSPGKNIRVPIAPVAQGEDVPIAQGEAVTIAQGQAVPIARSNTTITKWFRGLPPKWKIVIVTLATLGIYYFFAKLFRSSSTSRNPPAVGSGSLGGGPSVSSSVSHCSMISVNGDVSCSPPGCSVNCPGMAQSTASQSSISCLKSTVGSTTTCEPARCTSGCPGYEISPGDNIAQLREQYGIQENSASNNIAQLRAQYGMQENSASNKKILCRDAASAYYCSVIEQCGRGSCIPPNRLRCDDKPDGSTYDCLKGQKCGKGRCIPIGKKLCDTGSQSRFCNGLNACCQGTLPTNSEVSCFLGSSCPAGTVQVMEYQHLDYQYYGEVVPA
uniref:Uncharacterized protein n=1 Tax=viral metagenome TaxID=1070528 RepID=A0A6C0IYP2_9ZZZZ